MSGTWGTCASGYCLDGRAVDLAGVGTGGQAPSDFDGDGSVETRAQELDGLVGAPVTLLAQSSGSGAPLVLLVLNGQPWR